MKCNRPRWFEVKSQVSRSSATARRRRKHWVLEGLEGRLLLSGSPTPYTVNATSDTGAGSGDTGDLRYCITQANTNTNPAGSLIQFDPTVFTPSFGRGDYPVQLAGAFRKGWAGGDRGHRLSNPPPAPLSSAGVSISGNSAFPMFTVDPA